VGRGCKHIAATLIAYARTCAEKQVVPDLADLLASMERDDLSALLLALAESNVDFYNAIVTEVSVLHTSDISGESPPDVAAIRAAARSAMRTVRAEQYSRYDYYDDEGYPEFELEPLLDPLRRMIDAGQPERALPALDAVTEEVMSAWDRWDHEYYEAEDVFDAPFSNLVSLWTRAALAGEISDDDRVKWTKKLRAWEGETSEKVWQDAIDALAHGWTAPLIQKMLSGEDVFEEADDFESETLYEIRFDVLKSQNRMQEAFYLARITGQPISACEALIALGRPADARAYALAGLNSRSGFLKVSRALWDSGAREDALVVGERGLAAMDENEGVYSHHENALAKWVRDAAMEMNRPDLAERAAEAAYRQSPTLADFLLIRDLSGDRWEKKRAALLKLLGEPRMRSTEAGVDIFLHEQLWDEALGAAENSYASGALVKAIEATISERPVRVFAIATRKAERIMNEGKAQYYDEAADWLSYARAAYEGAGKQAEWSAYLQKLLFDHGRKYKLVPLLRQLQ
jgi:uncharacterized Zn finger protein